MNQYTESEFIATSFGHPIIRNAKKPDFIIHEPGNMSNLVVIEVKPVTVKNRLNELREDLGTLKWFLNEANYYRAVMLIYGNINGSLPEEIRQEIRNIDDSRIIVLWHSEPNKKPNFVCLQHVSRNSARRLRNI